MASTASGWQYAVPNDTLVAWPAVSQAVADKLEAVLGATDVDAAWTTYAPFITSAGSPPWAAGNGVFNYSKYIKIGKTVHFLILFTFGTLTTKATGNVMTITLPVTAAYSPSGHFVGRAAAGGGSFFLNAAMNSSTTMTVFAQNSSGAYLSLSGITASVPATWVTNDTLLLCGTYEAA